VIGYQEQISSGVILAAIDFLFGTENLLKMIGSPAFIKRGLKILEVWPSIAAWM
jgi:hypothetical protein